MIRELFEQNPQLKKTILYVLLGIVALIVIGVVVSSLKPEKVTYEELEEKIEIAAKNYYKKNKDQLPQENATTTISVETLINSRQIKDLKKYNKNGDNCSGRVNVKNNNNIYSYTAFLDCGADYKTLELYNKVLSDNNIVTYGDGLYIQGDTKIFRGEKVNNFVSDSHNLWQIVNIDSDNSIKLILYNGKTKTVFDDRYNSEKNSTVGKNTYKLSRLKETTDILYNDTEIPFLSDNIKAKLVSKPLCIGGRTETETINNGSIECSETLEGEYVGHLTLYEYINASTDTKCSSADTNECQNYNYLSKSYYGNSWWLITPVKENTYQVYHVNSNGSISFGKSSMNMAARPTINLSAETVYVSGIGTEEDPYIIR